MRWIFRIIGAVVVLVLLALGVLAFLPGDKIASFAAREISARTGREVLLSGDVKPVFYPVLGVRTGPVSVANADWSDGTPLLKADSLLVGVELMPLLSGNVKIRELQVESPVIRLERAKDGRGNWELGATAAQPATDTASANSNLAGFSLADGRITNGTFYYIDHQAGTSVDLSSVDLALSLPNIQSQI
ncbi:MAG: AsmA family protein, partial [Rhodobacter sp.]|nr:AsmA family protein [Rhodobacter sp.]